jgi:hypothetical protein
MAFDVQDGGRKSRKHNFEIWQHFCIRSFAMSLSFKQQHELNSYFIKLAKMVGRSKMADQYQFFFITLEVVDIFSICFISDASFSE